MKKRLISLVLMLAMVVSTLAVLTGCNNGGNSTGLETIKPMTITIAMITEEETTQEGIQAVQDALNKITEKTLNTHVVLQLYTKDEYDAAIEAKIKARLEYRANNKTDLTSFGTDEDKTVNDFGREITVYPEPYENQIDIFLLNGVNNLEYFSQFPKAGVSDEDYAADPVTNGQSVLADLKADLGENGAGALINKYISADLINNCMVGEALNAIPSNGFYGNSEYLIINKELFDKYQYNIEDITDIISLEDFLTDVATYETGVKPLYNYGSLGLVSVTGKNSVLAAYVPDNADPAAQDWTPESIVTNRQFMDAVTSINNYASISEYPVVGTDLSEAETGKFAAGFVSTDALGIQEYQDEYYTVLAHKSLVSTDQVYDNAFAVFAFSSDVQRCMQVVNLIQTDREFHNILLYGVENLTYTVDEDTGLVSRKHEGTDGAVYSMDMNLCGNLFISKPNDEMTVAELKAAENDWKIAKEASRSIAYSPYMGFELDVAMGVAEDYVPNKDNHYQPDSKTVDQLEMLYNLVFDEIALYPTMIDETTGELMNFNTYLFQINDKVQKAEAYTMYNQLYTNDDDLTVKKQYIRWWEAKYPPAA